MTPAIVVLDIGKSNVKLALLDRESRTVMALKSMRNTVVAGSPYPHFDVDRIWSWIVDGLRVFGDIAKIEVISTTTHGAAFALLSEDGLALPVIDYEFDGPDSVASDYAEQRGRFDEILSPSLPGGLNVGRQLFWLARTYPGPFSRVTTILPYPQYWVWRLTGIRVAEASSFGAHTDLWNARAGTYSGLAKTQGWSTLFPPLVKAWDSVGTLLPPLAATTGLPADCRVVAGIHDSNASLLPHILFRTPPFAVISTGTWMITFAPGGSLDRLDAEHGGLAYVDAFARPVPSAMSMAGREYEMLTGGSTVEPDDDDIAKVIAARIMALPAFVAGNGPFGRRRGNWTHAPETFSAGERNVAASLYVALVAETCLHLTGAEGPILIEGPFARNPIFLAALAALVDMPVIGRPDATGTTEGAALLGDGPGQASPRTGNPPPAEPLSGDFAAYALEWRRAAAL